MQLERYSFPVRTCVEEAMELLASSASAKQIELILDADPDLPEQVMGDAGRLRQVLVCFRMRSSFPSKAMSWCVCGL